jgi:methylmalonyl-CoA mutase
MSDFEVCDLFEPATREQWLGLVDKVLKGGDFEKRLVARTADGLRIAPLYTRADELTASKAAAPGAAPYTRGARLRSGAQGWDIRQTYAETDPARANEAILEDLAGGVTSLEIQVAAPGTIGLAYTGEAFEQALDGVMLDVCPVALLAGEYTVDATGSLMALWRKCRIADEACRGAFNADPLGTLARAGALYHPIGKSLEIAARLAVDSASMPGVTALLADGRPYHAAGATEAQELAAILATLAAYLRAMEAAGVAPGEALPKIAVGLAVDADQFLGLAKLRAARKLVWRLADACGAGDAVERVSFAAETSPRMMAKRDPWVNMLRTTMACAAAAMGGADSITVLPFTWALGRPDAFARRIARNTQIVLMEESGLGRVLDPAGGSWAVEKLTEDLARKAWETFQAIEAKGGMSAALTSGFIQDAIGEQAEARAKRVATGQFALTGTSAFPLLGNDGVKVEPWPGDVLSADLKGVQVKPLRAHRLAEPFEALRDAADAFAERHGHRPKVFLVSLGDIPVHSVRATFAGNFLAAGGVEGIASGPLHTSAEAGRAFAESGAGIACLCSSDQVYAELGEATAQALKSAGARRVLLAGRPREIEAQLEAAGVDDFIYAGCDMVAALRKLHADLGIPRAG